MGARITETEDGLVIEGREALRGTVVDSNNHSHAMALSVAGLAATGRNNDQENAGRRHSVSRILRNAEQTVMTILS